MPTSNLVVRMELDRLQLSFGDVAATVGKAGGDIVSIDMIHSGKKSSIRDITIDLSDTTQQTIVESLGKLPGIRLIHVSDATFLAHLGGKIAIQPKLAIRNRDDLSKVYTPGVAKVCKAILEEPEKAFSLTIKHNTVAVITDGTAVLGLGDIGPYAAAPVMEGKAMLFKQLADVDAFPICVDTTDPERIIELVKQISPIFGGINLEDISAPRCFEIEARLSEQLNIPVFHDDQHGTAIVLLAALLNALKVVNKELDQIKVVVNGIGAAGVSICKMLLAAGVRRLVPIDREGAIVQGGRYANAMWQWLADQPEVQAEPGKLNEAIRDADVFVGVSRSGVLTVEDVRSMAPDAIVFAMANPVPEIDPEEALPYVRVLGTGRSDYPNQINNVLCFPGMFRGLLDCRAERVNEEMKLAAARAIAAVVKDDERNEQYIVPSIFNDAVVPAIRKAVIEAAIATGVARKIPPEFRQ